MALSLRPVGLNFGLLEDPSLSATNLLNSSFSSSSMSRVLIISSMSAVFSSSLTLLGRLMGSLTLLGLNLDLRLPRGGNGILGLFLSTEVSTTFSLSSSGSTDCGVVEVVVDSLTRALALLRMELFLLSSVLNRELGFLSRLGRLPFSTEADSGADSVVLSLDSLRSSSNIFSSMALSASDMSGPDTSPEVTSLSISFSVSSRTLLDVLSLGIRDLNLSRPRKVCLRLSLGVSKESSRPGLLSDCSVGPSDFSNVSRAPSFKKPLCFSIWRNPRISELSKSPPLLLGSSLTLEGFSGTEFN